MKTLFAITSIVSMVIMGIVSYKLFSSSQFYASALLTIASYLTASLLVNVLGNRKMSL
ncbi:MAG: hypothetical protein JST47_07325 [Bacteroidetes bacterium]|nr:hypothetical protein [Bacteroidota bacterium]MBS1975144.1 hypothetical protein [Bacteroidota bacterium]